MSIFLMTVPQNARPTALPSVFAGNKAAKQSVQLKNTCFYLTIGMETTNNYTPKE